MSSATVRAGKSGWTTSASTFCETFAIGAKTLAGGFISTGHIVRAGERKEIGPQPSLAQNASRQRARIALRPASCVDRLEKLVETGIEGCRLLQVDRVAGIRHHHEGGACNRALHQQRWFQAGPILVSGQ